MDILEVTTTHTTSSNNSQLFPHNHLDDLRDINHLQHDPRSMLEPLPSILSPQKIRFNFKPPVPPDPETQKEILKEKEKEKEKEREHVTEKVKFDWNSLSLEFYPTKERRKKNTMVSTRKLCTAIYSSNLPLALKHIRRADFHSVGIVFQKSKIKVGDLPSKLCDSYWNSNPFEPMSWHIHKAIHEAIEDSLRLGFDLLTLVLRFSEHSTLGGHKILSADYSKLIEDCLSLVRKGANVNYGDGRGHILTKAIIFNVPEVVEALLVSGATEFKKIQVHLNFDINSSVSITQHSPPPSQSQPQLEKHISKTPEKPASDNSEHKLKYLRGRSSSLSTSSLLSSRSIKSPPQRVPSNPLSSSSVPISPNVILYPSPRENGENSGRSRYTSFTLEADSCVNLATALYSMTEHMFVICSANRSAIIEMFYKIGLISGKDMIKLAIRAGDSEFLLKLIDFYQESLSQLDIWETLLCSYSRSLIDPTLLLSRGAFLGDYHLSYHLSITLYGEYKRTSDFPAYPSHQNTTIFFQFVYRELYENADGEVVFPPGLSSRHIDIQHEGKSLVKNWVKKIHKWEKNHNRMIETLDDLLQAAKTNTFKPKGLLKRRLSFLLERPSSPVLPFHGQAQAEAQVIGD